MPEVNLFPFVFGQSAIVSPVQVTAEDSAFGAPFLFTEEARVNLLRSFGVPQSYIDGTPPEAPAPAPTPRPRRPHHGHS